MGLWRWAAKRIQAHLAPATVGKDSRQYEPVYGSYYGQGITYEPCENSLEFSWRHAYYNSCLNMLAQAANEVPVKVMRLKPKSVGRKAILTQAGAKSITRRLAAFGHDERQWRGWLSKEQDVEAEEVADAHPLRLLLEQVNPLETWLDFSAKTVLHLKGAGNAYWELVGGEKGKPPTELWTMQPDRVSIVPDAKRRIGGYRYSANGKTIAYAPEEVLHFKLPHPMDDLYGLAPAATLDHQLKADWARLQFTQAMFENGVSLSGILTAETEMEDTTFRRAWDAFKASYAGQKNAGKVGAFNGPVKFTPTQSAPKDTPFVELATQHELDISAVLGVPSALLSRTRDVNRSNFDAAALIFWSSTMVPLLRQRDGQINEFLAPRFGDGLFVMSDFSEVKALQEETTAVVTRETAAFDAGFKTLDEVRVAIGDEPLDGGNGAGQLFKRKAGDTYVPLEDVINPPPEPEPQPAPEALQQPADETQPEEEQRPPEKPVPDEKPPAKTLWTPRRVKAVEYGSDEHRAKDAAFQDRIRPAEEKLVTDIRTLAKQTERDILAKLEAEKSYKASLPPVESLLLSLSDTGRALYALVNQVVRDRAIAAGDRLLAEVGISGMTFDPNDPLVQAHIAAKELLITTIPDEWHATLRAQLLEGMADGESVAELQKRVSAVYDGIYDWQAQRIAQTEVVGAENVGTWAAMNEAGVERKSWLATLDNRVRDSHAACHAQGAIPVDEAFANGLMHPGGSGPAAEVVNCRCSLAAEVD